MPPRPLTTAIDSEPGSSVAHVRSSVSSSRRPRNGTTACRAINNVQSGQSGGSFSRAGVIRAGKETAWSLPASVSSAPGDTPASSRNRSSPSNAVTGTTSSRPSACPAVVGVTTPMSCPAGSATTTVPHIPRQSASGTSSSPALAPLAAPPIVRSGPGLVPPAASALPIGPAEAGGRTLNVRVFETAPVGGETRPDSVSAMRRPPRRTSWANPLATQRRGVESPASRAQRLCSMPGRSAHTGSAVLSSTASALPRPRHTGSASVQRADPGRRT